MNPHVKVPWSLTVLALAWWALFWEGLSTRAWGPQDLLLLGGGVAFFGWLFYYFRTLSRVAVQELVRATVAQVEQR